MPNDTDRFALLAAVGDATGGSPLLGELVQRLLDLIVPAFADVATVDVVGATGEMRRLGARVDAPRDLELESALLTRHQSGDLSVGVLKVANTGESELLAPISDATLDTISTSEGDLALLRALDLGSTMYVPLVARDRTLGVLACSTRGAERIFTPDDLRFGEVLAGRIGLALDNAGLSATVSGLERRLEATLANLAAGVVVRDRSGAMVFANQAAAELLGMESVEAFFAATAEQMMELFDAHDERGRRLTLADLPSARAMRGERPAPMIVRSVRRPEGRVRWVLHQATPVFDADGTLELAVNVLEDVTAAKRAEFAQRLLADVSRELSSSLDYEQTLARVARLAVPELADWCGVSIIAGDVLHQVAVAHVDPEKVALARAWGERFPTRLDRPSGAAEVARSGRPLLVPELTDEVLAAAGADEERLALVREIGMRSIIIVPLALPEGQPFGTLTLVMADSGRRFETDDLAVAEELGRRAAMAVENARLYTERSRVATVLQRSLLPPALPDVPGFRLASLYQPAGMGSEVGGDFYDAYAVPGGWMVVVGDITGHGPEAAALTALSRFTLRTAGRLLGDPAQAVEQLAMALLDQPQLSLVSLCCAKLSTEGTRSVADIVLAGHPPAYHLRGACPSAVGRPGPLLGLGEPGRWSSATVELEPGDLLVLYTDGVTDTFGVDGRFGERRLIDTITGADDAEDLVRRIEVALAAFAYGDQRDDTAVLAVQCAPLGVVGGARMAGVPAGGGQPG